MAKKTKEPDAETLANYRRIREGGVKRAEIACRMLRQRRIDMDMSHEVLGECLGLHRRTVSRMECGSQRIGIDVYFAWLMALGLTSDA